MHVSVNQPSRETDLTLADITELTRLDVAEAEEQVQHQDRSGPGRGWENG